MQLHEKTQAVHRSNDSDRPYTSDPRREWNSDCDESVGLKSGEQEAEYSLRGRRIVPRMKSSLNRSNDLWEPT